LITTLVFEKNANFFAENCRKSPKIIIITSTPGHPELPFHQNSQALRLFLKLVIFGNEKMRTMDCESVEKTMAAFVAVVFEQN
jgi:hypothetical protein